MILANKFMCLATC
uniref:Uncharacterized protein n=1 Tax=Rhizophora mucronata TaxID=61149 RepID=A0A2P2PEZ0_RHIMU